MLNIDTAEAVLLVVLGGLFGWVLSKLPETWVFAIAAASFVLFIVIVSTR